LITLDRYTITARLVPAVAVALPTGLALAMLFPQDLVTWGAGTGVLTTTGLTLLLAENARRRGKAVEARIHEKLGAKPTTILLRHSDDRIEAPTKSRYHACLARIVPGVSLPSPDEEADDPGAADVQYQSCVRSLLERTRDRSAFPLVFKELCLYGMVRNTRGLKGSAVLFALFGLSIGTARALWNAPQSVHEPAAVVALISLFLLMFWVFRLTDAWVEEVGFNYARALLACCERLDA